MNIKFEKYIANTLEAKELKNAYSYAFEIVETLAQQLRDNQYIATADSDTLKEWEILLSIPTDPSLTIDERRKQILLRLNMKPPYTLNNIKSQIYGITGIENEITMDYENLALNIDLTSASKADIKLVHQFIRGAKPATVVYSISITPKDLYDDSIYYMSATITKNITVV